MAPDKRKALDKHQKEIKAARELHRQHVLGMRDPDWPKPGSAWLETETGKAVKVRYISFQDSTHEWLITFFYTDDRSDNVLHTRTVHYWYGKHTSAAGKSRPRYEALA